ncbi:MAG: hypothetical protein ABR505_05895 [Actinomycetota bacterium]
MRRFSALVLVSFLCLSILPATVTESVAQKKKKKVERVEEKPYVGGFGVSGQPVQSICIADGIACARFPIEKGEKYLALEIADVSGQTVYASVYVYGYTDGTDAHEHICATTDRPFQLGPGVEEVVVIPASSAGNTTPVCTGLVTQGTVTATFSNIP